MIKPKVIVYTEEFLSPSMTFIARQIAQMSSHFDISVVTRNMKNIESMEVNCKISPVPMGLLERAIAAIRSRAHVMNWDSGCIVNNRIQKCVERENPVLIHAHFGPSGLQILPVAQKLRIPQITTFHGYDASVMLKRRDYRQQLKKLFEYSEIITVSEYMKSALITAGADPQRIHCKYIGVPQEKFTTQVRMPISEKIKNGMNIRFLQVSNFVEKKGHEYTLHAFAAFSKSQPNCNLTLVGSGPLRQATEVLARQLRIQDRTVFLEHKDSSAVAKQMADADCFLHHSVTSKYGDKEGIPTVIMEAMMAGLPVISTRHSGIPELISNGENGLLVEERDINGYVRALKAIMMDDGRLGRVAQESVRKRFDMTECSEELRQMYNKLID